MQLKIHPCCGARLDRWLKVLLSFDIVVSAIAIQVAVMGLFLISSLKLKWIPNPDLTDSALNVHVATIVVFLIFVVVDLLLDIWLWLLISEKDVLKCRIWFVIKLVLEVCDAIGLIVEVCSGQHTWIYIVGMSFDTLLTAFILWVVYAFIIQLRGVKSQNTNAGNGKVIFSTDRDTTNIV